MAEPEKAQFWRHRFHMTLFKISMHSFKRHMHLLTERLPRPFTAINLNQIKAIHFPEKTFSQLNTQLFFFTTQ